MFSTGTVVRVIDQTGVDLKLREMAPLILATNRKMVKEMLEGIVAEIQPGTPTGPGHFGGHLKDSYRVEVSSKGVQTSGSLKALPQGYWREFGTRGRFRGSRKAQRAYIGALLRQGGSMGGGGEKAGLFAAKAWGRMRRLLNFYYGEADPWWKGLRSL